MEYGAGKRVVCILNFYYSKDTISIQIQGNNIVFFSVHFGFHLKCIRRVMPVFLSIRICTYLRITVGFADLYGM